MDLSTSPAFGAVVVVEDDEFTRTAASEALTDAGFNVIEAVDAADALMLLNYGATGIHALVTDNRMPGDMNGVKLAHYTRQNWPWIKLVVAAHLLEAGTSLPRGCRYFPKPYSMMQIVKHLQGMRETEWAETGALLR